MQQAAIGQNDIIRENKEQKNERVQKKVALNTETGRENIFFSMCRIQKVMISNLINATSICTRSMTSVISRKTETDSLSYEYEN